MKRIDFENLINNSSFSELFITEMGWNNPSRSSSFIIPIDSVDYEFNPIAEKSGFHVYSCLLDEIPNAADCKKIDNKLRSYGYDYICIFVQRKTSHHLWLTPVKTNEMRELVKIEYLDGAKADFLFSKIDDLSFELTENVLITDVKNRVQGSFHLNSEKITKDFYTQFRKEHTAFKKYIRGISNDKDIDWYTSVMLNRLMFCYFVQKKGFLDMNTNYLQDKLKWVKEQQGENKFFGTFYKGFLVALFHEGLNRPTHETAEFLSIYGRIPYLNGGMFEEHQLERENNGIDIDDIAFENLFNFFDKWNWHLDTRLTASGKDINPDVLGYIFEQYINDRAQMGAYYTKEDITEYIGRNTIVPYLMDATRKHDEKPFKPNGEVWTFLKQNGDRYVFDAVKKGAGLEIPEEVAIGLDTQQPNLLERRKHWNDRTPEAFALPTEIWRETIERLQRYNSIKAKIENGEITSINDFITYNLDIRQFVYDLLNHTHDHLLVKHFYAELQKVTILDPTCGSGAFLFAALNILEPLYEVCISRMQEFREQNPNLFKDELQEIEHKYRSNIQYFIYKSIILRNLYGVDIMVEATEIAKLRLFLKMVAVVEVNKREANLGLDPLPDIDFNIRCGNTLVGYATAEELENDLTWGDMFANAEFRDKVNDEMDKVAHTYNMFKHIQLTQGDDMATFKRAKADLKERLKALNDLLNRRLFMASAGADYEAWLASHQPFHWLAEFYEIINGNGGFDVIIGNPPYLEVRQIDYKISGYKTIDSGAVHAFCMERSLNLIHTKGNMSMIVPIALVCTQRMTTIQQLLENNRSSWYSNFAWRPAKLFDAVNRALSIFVVNASDTIHHYTTPYQKWISENRKNLFKEISYTQYDVRRDSFWMPKLSSDVENRILECILRQPKTIGNYITNRSQSKVYYRTTGGLYWKVFTNFAPMFLCNGVEGHSSRETSLIIPNDNQSSSIVAFLSSNLFWWWYTVTSNLRDLNPSDIYGIRFPENLIENPTLQKLGIKYLDDLKANSTMLTREQKNVGTTQTQSFKINKSKPIIDEIDKVLAKHYGFTEEELDFIINYDIKYRMGDELGEE